MHFMYCIDFFELATFEDLAAALINVQVLGNYAAAIVVFDCGRNMLYLQDLSV